MSSEHSEYTRLTTRRKVLAASGSATMLGIAGCLGDDDDVDDTEDETTDDTDDDTADDTEDETTDETTDEPETREVTLLVERAGNDHDHDEEVEEFEIIDRDHDEVAAYIHGDHWHGHLPDVSEGEHISLGANIVDDHGDAVEFDGDHHALGVELAHGAEEGIVSFDDHGDHVHIIGEEEGETEVVFQWLHDGHTEYETPPIAVSVGHDHEDEHDEEHDDDDHDEEVEEFEIIDRDHDEVTAYIHGDHWDGHLPDVPEGEHISLGANIVDDHGDAVELDGDHHALGVELAHGAEEGIVSFDDHGDHVHIIGEEEGETEVVFQWLHDGHTEYETPPIAVSVGHDHEDEHDHDDEHDLAEEGLSEHDIDHACGHMELDAPEPLEGGTEDVPAVISETHQPYTVEFDDDSAYVRFDVDAYGNGSSFAFFTEEGEISAVVGEKIYEEHGVDACGSIGMYVIIEPDHGEVVVEVSPE